MKWQRSWEVEIVVENARTFWPSQAYLSISFLPGNESLFWAKIIYLKGTYTFHMSLLYIGVRPFFVCMYVCIRFCYFSAANRRYYRNVSSLFFVAVSVFFRGVAARNSLTMDHPPTLKSRLVLPFSCVVLCLCARIVISVLLKLWIHKSSNLVILLLQFGYKNNFISIEKRRRKV